MNSKFTRLFSEISGLSLSTSLIVVAISLVCIALFVKNKWVKAAVLAYEVLP